MAEDRLDRIEKNVENLLQGIAELRVFQTQTTEQIRALGKYQEGTSKQFDPFREFQEETGKQIREVWKSQAETSRQFDAFREFQEETGKQIREAWKSQAKTSRQLDALREFQEETSKQIREVWKSQAETNRQFDAFREFQKETGKQIREVWKFQEETNKRFDALREFQEETGIQIRDLRKNQEETSKKIDKLIESQIKSEQQWKKTTRRLDEIGRQLGDLGLVQGEVAEDLFYRNVKTVFRKQDIVFSDIRRNLKKKGEGEFDIVAADGGKVLVIEVKNKLSKRMIDLFVDRKLPRFKDAFDEYADFEIYGGMGALVVKDDVGRYAERKGLYVLTQTDEGGATLLNRGNFKPKSFG